MSDELVFGLMCLGMNFEPMEIGIGNNKGSF